MVLYYSFYLTFLCVNVLNFVFEFVDASLCDFHKGNLLLYYESVTINQSTTDSDIFRHIFKQQVISDKYVGRPGLAIVPWNRRPIIQIQVLSLKKNEK